MYVLQKENDYATIIKSYDKRFKSKPGPIFN